MVINVQINIFTFDLADNDSIFEYICSYLILNEKIKFFTYYIVNFVSFWGSNLPVFSLMHVHVIKINQYDARLQGGKCKNLYVMVKLKGNISWIPTIR